MAKTADALGGTLEASYSALGEDDSFVVMDFPDDVSAAAASLIANATGTVRGAYTVLITPEELDLASDLAAAKGAAYRPPGHYRPLFG